MGKFLDKNRISDEVLERAMEGVERARINKQRHLASARAARAAAAPVTPRHPFRILIMSALPVRGETGNWERFQSAYVFLLCPVDAHRRSPAAFVSVRPQVSSVSSGRRRSRITSLGSDLVRAARHVAPRPSRSTGRITMIMIALTSLVTNDHTTT
ncbi:hypothetical protein EVAR_58530_1 [Eumeta japonica]|uniref:Uncharacterized protein n=1 Tax=Eumeta variegata TaxID=151549 RepID=A0A4C1Z5Z2_EUMVA|nr:hypothetical protein EVAR_58530_1 [Eumeta japonica]